MIQYFHKQLKYFLLCVLFINRRFVNQWRKLTSQIVKTFFLQVHNEECSCLIRNRKKTYIFKAASIKNDPANSFKPWTSVNVVLSEETICHSTATGPNAFGPLCKVNNAVPSFPSSGSEANISPSQSTRETTPAAPGLAFITTCNSWLV